MNEEMFMMIVLAVREYDYYSMCKPNCMGLYEFSSVKKYTAAIRCIALKYHVI
jgi:hypothetical protein